MYIKRTLSAVITKDDWRALKPLLKTKDHADQWTIVNVSGYWEDIFVEIALKGPYFDDLNDIFAATVADWEK